MGVCGCYEIFFDNVKTWVGLLDGRLEDGRVSFEVGVDKVYELPAVSMLDHIWLTQRSWKSRLFGAE